MLNFLQIMNERFSENTNNYFKNYLNRFPNDTVWWIISDYCLNTSGKNNVMSFVVIPYVDDVRILMEEINKNIPKDLKKTSNIDEKIIKMLNNADFFRISFILEKDYYFSGRNAETFKHIINEYTNMLRIWAENDPNMKKKYDSMIKNFNRFKEELKRKVWNKKLTENIFALSFFASFIAYFIKKHAKVKGTYWFSDRDDMTRTYEGLIFDLYIIQVNTFCRSQGIDYESIDYFEQPDTDIEKMWYDDFIKLPDYICGALADYNFTNEEIGGIKHNILQNNLLIDNINNLVFKVSKNNVNKIEFHKKID